MISWDALLRPFSSWNVDPYPDEPAHGYFARLVAEEEHISSRVYATEIGVNGRDIVPTEQLEVILQLPIPDEWRQRLQRATPVYSEAGITIAGEDLGFRQWSISKRRFCPACLGEASYHRTWWDILSINECPFHRIAMQDTDPEGRPLKWWWPHMDHSPKGAYLGMKRIARASPHPTFAGYVLGRLGFVEKHSVPLLDSVSLRDVIETCDFMGRLLGSGRARISPSSWDQTHRIGFDAVSQGPARLVHTLRAWLNREVPEAVRRRGYNVAFGWANTGRHLLCREHSDLVQQAMKKSVAAESRTAPREITDTNFRDREIGIEALAQELGIFRRGVNAIAARLGILPEREWYRARVHFDAEQAGVIRAFMVDLVTTQEATAILGLPKFQLTPLIDAGFLERVPNVTGPGKRGSRFMRSQAQCLMSDVIEKVAVGDVKGSCSLIVYARHMRVEPGHVAALVARNQLKPTCRRRNAVGFMSLRFPHPSGVTYRLGPARTPTETLERIKSLALSNPLLGRNRISKLLAAEGIDVSASTIQRHLNGIGLGKQARRISAASPLRPRRKAAHR